MKIRVLGDRILVQRLMEDEIKESKIIIPLSAKKLSMQAKVLALGIGKDIPPEIKVGGTIFVGRYTGIEFKIGGEEFSILKCDDILAVINP